MSFRNDDYLRIESALQFLETHWRTQPSLEQIAAHVQLSPFHFQRLFQRWAGVTPKRFLQHLTLSYVRQQLKSTSSVLQAALEAGLSGPSRLHDLCVSLHGVTPGDHRSGGQHLNIEWGLHPSPFGTCFIAVTDRGVCALGFECAHAQPGSITCREELLSELREDFRNATIVHNQDNTKVWVDRAFNTTSAGAGLAMFVRGTRFQVRVWQALLAVPEGCLTTYQAIAHAIGSPAACRAVGNAVGSNPISWLIPCHRVIRAMGPIGHYRWGRPRKQAMLAWEASRTNGEANHESALQTLPLSSVPL